MKLRCKDGDIAVITWDFPECLENIGRLVQVRGPVTTEDGVAYWRIQPVTPELYAFRELDDSLGREHVTWSSRINHPDGWMVPLEPDDDTTGMDETVVLQEPAAVSACAAAQAKQGTPACSFVQLTS